MTDPWHPPEEHPGDATGWGALSSRLGGGALGLVPSLVLACSGIGSLLGVAPWLEARSVAQLATAALGLACLIAAGVAPLVLRRR